MFTTKICLQAPSKQLSPQDNQKDKRFRYHETDVATLLALHQKGINVSASSAEPLTDSRSVTEMLASSSDEVNKQYANPIRLNYELTTKYDVVRTEQMQQQSQSQNSTVDLTE